MNMQITKGDKTMTKTTTKTFMKSIDKGNGLIIAEFAYFPLIAGFEVTMCRHDILFSVKIGLVFFEIYVAIWKRS